MEEPTSASWPFLGNRLPKSEIVNFCQIFVVYVIIVTSIVYLSLENDKTELWKSLLSSTIGYALPSPTLKTGTL